MVTRKFQTWNSRFVPLCQVSKIGILLSLVNQAISASPAPSGRTILPQNWYNPMLWVVRTYREPLKLFHSTSEGERLSLTEAPHSLAFGSLCD